MLNRRILRIKAFKVLYSYAENPSMTLKEALSQLEISCEATRTLYLFMLDLIPALTGEALSRIDAARRKFNPTEEERNPNMKFVRNSVASLLSQDPDFTKIVGKKKLSWDQYDVFLRKLYEDIKTRDYFIEYMASEEGGLEEDAALFTKIFENELADNDELDAILEELSIYWTDKIDLVVALNACCRTMDEFASGRRWSLPSLYNSDAPNAAQSDGETDKSFVTKLLTSACASYQRHYDMIAGSAKGWDKDRLFTTDAVLIAAGLAEHETFPQIHTSIILNEYVEITKYYSTPKSKAFVNGVLDRLFKEDIKPE